MKGIKDAFCAQRNQGDIIQVNVTSHSNPLSFITSLLQHTKVNKFHLALVYLPNIVPNMNKIVFLKC